MPSRPISTHAQPSGLAPVDPTFISGALGVVLQVYEATLTHDMDTFEPYALRCLGRLIGFDGAVWGSGVLQGHGIQGLSITRASVVDRPATLLSEYAGLAAFDPATLRFLACPQQPIAVGVDDYGRSRSGAAVGGYLRRHRIAQLLLQGSETAARATPVRSRQWITAYRETDRRFDGQDIARLQALLPLWNQARELCLVRQLERLGRAHLTQGTAVALCDRLGLIHVAEPAFSELTQLGRGDTVLAVCARALEPGSARSPVNSVGMRVEAAGAWMLVVATRGGASQGLSQRERQVALHYVQGLSYKEIARELGSSPSTVRTQLQTVYRRLGVHSRTQLQRALCRSGPT